MSFARQVYFAAILAGWAALFGWVVCEFVILPRTAGAAWEAIPSAGMVGAAIGAGVGAAAALASGGTTQLLLRAGGGLIGGFFGGLIGGLVGQGLYWIGLPQWLGWTVIGVGIGGTDALFGRDARRLRNGLLGGLLGGLVGGLLFRLFSTALQGGTGMTARAIGFVAIGIAIGAMVGLVQVLLRNAWLTVIDGEGAGRQLLLAGAAAPLGSSPAAALVLGGSGVEPDHAALVRTGSGYAIEDNSTGGTLVNDRPVVGRSPLANGDVIRIGSTYLRFNMSARVVQTNAEDEEDEVHEELPARPKPAPPAADLPPRPVPHAALPLRPTPAAKPTPPPPVAPPKPVLPPRPVPHAALPLRPTPAAKPAPPPPVAPPKPVLPPKPPAPAISKPSNPMPATDPPPPKPVTPPLSPIKQSGAICSECGAAVSGRICSSCGAMS